jgi:hypothetical protein
LLVFNEGEALKLSNFILPFKRAYLIERYVVIFVIINESEIVGFGFVRMLQWELFLELLVFLEEGDDMSDDV